MVRQRRCAAGCAVAHRGVRRSTAGMPQELLVVLVLLEPESLPLELAEEDSEEDEEPEEPEELSEEPESLPLSLLDPESTELLLEETLSVL